MDGLSTSYRLSKEQSWLLHHVHILHMVLLALNLSILDAGILILDFSFGPTQGPVPLGLILVSELLGLGFSLFRVHVFGTKSLGQGLDNGNVF